MLLGSRFLVCSSVASLRNCLRRAFDAIAEFIEGAVVLALHLPATAEWDDSHCPQAFDFGDDGGEVIALVGQYGLCLTTFQQRQGLGIFGP